MQVDVLVLIQCSSLDLGTNSMLGFKSVISIW